MKISKSKIRKLINESLMKEFKDTGGFEGIDDIDLGGADLPPPPEDDSGGGGGDEEPKWNGPQSFWIYELNPDQTPSKKKIYLSKSIFERIMKIFYTLSKRADDINDEYRRRQEIGQDLTQQERDQFTAENKPILEPLWHIDKELGRNLIAINSPIAWFNQKYQIHIHAANPVWNNLMELYTVEILSAHLIEHDFEEYRKNL